MTRERGSAICGLAIFVALVVVGCVSDGIVRHIVQTAPVWIIVILSLRGSALAKWVAAPIFAFWLVIMSLIWLYLLGIAHLVGGTYSPIEIAMSILAGVASVVGLALFFCTPWRASWISAALTVAVVGALQFGLFVVSLRSPISHDTTLRAWLHI